MAVDGNPSKFASALNSFDDPQEKEVDRQYVPMAQSKTQGLGKGENHVSSEKKTTQPHFHVNGPCENNKKKSFLGAATDFFIDGNGAELAMYLDDMEGCEEENVKKQYVPIQQPQRTAVPDEDAPEDGRRKEETPEDGGRKEAEEEVVNKKPNCRFIKKYQYVKEGSCDNSKKTSFIDGLQASVVDGDLSKWAAFHQHLDNPQDGPVDGRFGPMEHAQNNSSSPETEEEGPQQRIDNHEDRKREASEMDPRTLRLHSKDFPNGLGIFIVPDEDDKLQEDRDPADDDEKQVEEQDSDDSTDVSDSEMEDDTEDEYESALEELPFPGPERITSTDSNRSVLSTKVFPPEKAGGGKRKKDESDDSDEDEDEDKNDTVMVTSTAAKPKPKATQIRRARMSSGESEDEDDALKGGNKKSRTGSPLSSKVSKKRTAKTSGDDSDDKKKGKTDKTPKKKPKKELPSTKRTAKTSGDESEDGRIGKTEKKPKKKAKKDKPSAKKTSSDEFEDDDDSSTKKENTLKKKTKKIPPAKKAKPAKGSKKKDEEDDSSEGEDEFVAEAKFLWLTKDNADYTEARKFELNNKISKTNYKKMYKKCTTRQKDNINNKMAHILNPQQWTTVISEDVEPNEIKAVVRMDGYKWRDKGNQTRDDERFELYYFYSETGVATVTTKRLSKRVLYDKENKILIQQYIGDIR